MSKHKKNNLEKAHSQHQLNGKKLQEMSLKLKKKLVGKPSAITTNNIKYLQVTLTNNAKDLYDKNFKSLKK